MNYDFNHAFSPAEFEDFARDMLQMREDRKFESFAEGKDKGIDSRSVSEDGYTVILQAKRLKNAGANIMKIVRCEKEKMDSLVRAGERVDRYILVISDDLSVQTKEKVYQLMSPYIIHPQDIVTKKDLNNWLGDDKYRCVEDKYYQLWIPSVKVLKKKLFEMVNSALVQRSVDCYKKVLEKRQIFVETEVFREAVLQLKKNRVLIISGEPGVGKTTLAEQVALYFFAKYRYQVFINACSVDDLYTALEMEGKKVVLYDDFWGSNGFDRFYSGRRAKELVRFIEHVRTHKDCLLIMTTREYILEQGLKENEELRELVTGNKLACRIEQYSREDKLQIYYGHLKYAKLTWGQTMELKIQGEAVMHSQYYNPRVIELFTKSVSVNMSPEECVETFEQYLKCPVDFWKKIFHDLSQEAKILYVLLLIFPMPIELEYLEKCYREAQKAFEHTFEWKSFSDVIIELEKTVIRTDLYNEEHAKILSVTFQNPSAKDFLFVLLKEDFEKYYGLLQDNCQYYAQYVELLKALEEVQVSSEIYAELFKKAMKAVNSVSLSFFDKYKDVLRYNNELKKYHQRYETEQDYRDIGFGRIFQLILLYRKGCGKEAKSKMRTVFLAVMREIADFPEHVLTEDLEGLEDVIIAACRQELCSDISQMVKIYMDAQMRNRMEIIDTKIKRAFPKVWEQYVKRYKKQIADYLEKYYKAEICLAAVSGEVEFCYQYANCQDCYEEYNMDIPETLQKKIDLYESWISAEENKMEEFTVREEDKKTKSVKEIHREFEEEFLRAILPTFVWDVEEWLETHNIPNQAKEILKRINEQGHLFWNYFLEDEDSLAFLETFILFKGELPEKMDAIFREITRYMVEKSGLKRNELVEFLTCLDETENHQKIWSKAELEELCPDLLFEREEFLENMVRAHILVNCCHWYRLSNELLLLCAQMAEAVSSADKLEGFYQSVQTQIFKSDKMKNKDRFFWEILYQLDAEQYKTYILPAAADKLYKDIMNSGRHWTKVLTDLLEMEICFEEGEVIEGTHNGSSILEIWGVYLDLELFLLIPSEFTEEQKSLLKQCGILGEGIETVTLGEIQEHRLLKSLGIYENLEMLWETICKHRTEV